MEASVSLELREQPSGVAVATPKLQVIEGGKKKRRRQPQLRKHRSRNNPESIFDAPEGFSPCNICSAPIPSEQCGSDIVICPNGHEIDVAALAAREFENPGGVTHVGLLNTEQGRLGEKIVWDLKDFGRYGQISKVSDHYWCPVDGETDQRWGVEVRSISSVARNHAFALSSKKKQRMNAYILERGFVGILGVLVIIDYQTSLANIYLRAMKQAVYWQKAGDPFRSDVPFDNPLLATAAVNPDLPF